MTLSKPELWAKITAHDLDLEGSALSFSQRLARENGCSDGGGGCGGGCGGG